MDITRGVLIGLRSMDTRTLRMHRNLATGFRAMGWGVRGQRGVPCYRLRRTALGGRVAMVGRCLFRLGVAMMTVGRLGRVMTIRVHVLICFVQFLTLTPYRIPRKFFCGGGVPCYRSRRTALGGFVAMVGWLILRLGVATLIVGWLGGVTMMRVHVLICFTQFLTLTPYRIPRKFFCGGVVWGGVDGLYGPLGPMMGGPGRRMRAGDMII